MYSDAHVHLDSYPAAERDDVIQRAHALGVELMVTVGTTLDTCEQAVALAEHVPDLYAGVGIHPWWVVPWSDELEARLRDLARRPRVKVVSEVGLDYTRGPTTQPQQRELLRHQIALARELRLPVMTHNDRPSQEDLLALLREEGAADVGGVIHGFRGDWPFARGCLDLGFVISLGRLILRPEGAEQLEVLRRLPRDGLVLETDSARQGPGPAEVALVAQRVGDVLDLPPEQVGNFTTANLKRVLRV
ncbi:MAG: TatD family hydrolase [Chloroflexi bacterium]|nr:TatD family hydrolase [Chloroflexota bacterium]